jgi:MYXO-CTERM domain-containing protein
VALALGAISTEDTGCGSGDEDDEASSAAIVAPMLLLALGLRRRRD